LFGDLRFPLSSLVPPVPIASGWSAIGHWSETAFERMTTTPSRISTTLRHLLQPDFRGVLPTTSARRASSRQSGWKSSVTTDRENRVGSARRSPSFGWSVTRVASAGSRVACPESMIRPRLLAWGGRAFLLAGGGPYNVNHATGRSSAPRTFCARAVDVKGFPRKWESVSTTPNWPIASAG